eukprot:6670692-Prymnesium_polylepis.1
MFRAASGLSSRQSDGKLENARTGIRTRTSRFMTWDAIHCTIRIFDGSSAPHPAGAAYIPFV